MRLRGLLRGTCSRAACQSCHARPGHLDLKIALGNQLLQPRILRLKLPQPPHIIWLKTAKAFAPGVDRLLADRYWFAIRPPG